LDKQMSLEPDTVKYKQKNKNKPYFNFTNYELLEVQTHIQKHTNSCYYKIQLWRHFYLEEINHLLWWTTTVSLLRSEFWILHYSTKSAILNFHLCIAATKPHDSLKVMQVLILIW
jgi:hypothetical protein